MTDQNARALLTAQGSTDLKDSVNQTASAGLIVQSYCTQVMQQPTIVIPDSVKNQLPDFNAYLKTAQTTAKSYLDEVQPQIIGVISDVGGYSSEFVGFYNLITEKIELWKTGSLEGKTDALALLGQLDKDLLAKRDNIVLVQTALGDFQGKLNFDISHMNEVQNQAEIIIGGDKGAIASYKDSIKKLNGQIAGASVGVGLSGLTIIAGGLMIAAGAIASFITAGTSTPLVLAGVAVVVVGTGGLIGSSIALANLLETKSKFLKEQKALESTLTFVTEFDSTVATLGSCAQNAATELGNMRNAWEFLGNNMKTVISSVENAKTYSELPIVVQAYLDTANKQWGDVKNSVTNIEKQMTGVKSVVMTDSKGNLIPLNGENLQKYALDHAA